MCWTALGLMQVCTRFFKHVPVTLPPSGKLRVYLFFPEEGELYNALTNSAPQREP